MRQPLRLNRGKVAVSSGFPLPIPVGGWDTVTPMAQMDPSRAILMDNIFPRATSLELRNGHAEHCDTGEAGVVKSLLPYHGTAPVNDKLFAACGTSVYNISTATPTEDITGLSSIELQSVNFTTSGGHYLFWVNGEDAPQHYDGSAWATPTITGATAADFVNINVFKNRLFFCENASTKAWFLPVDAIQGAADSFELGGLFSKGGYLIAMGTRTVDGGAGPDDQAVFISSRGQVVVYSGSDPSDATVWALVGVYDLPQPIGKRCLLKVAGDLAVLTVSGLLPLARATAIDQTAIEAIALTKNISPEISKAARSYGSNFGWQVQSYPRGEMAILNIPVSEGVTQHQYVMNTATGAWCRFTGQNAGCWAEWQGLLYFGGNSGKVYLADSAATDDGTPIRADLKTAFNYLGSRASLKRAHMVQTLMVSDGRVNPYINVNTDFNDVVPTSGPSSTNLGAIYWDEFNWDEVDWPPEQQVSATWQNSGAVGYCMAVRVRIVATVDTETLITLQINGFNLIIERGALL
jgi:hypothetical protein